MRINFSKWRALWWALHFVHTCEFWNFLLRNEKYGPGCALVLSHGAKAVLDQDGATPSLDALTATLHCQGLVTSQENHCVKSENSAPGHFSRQNKTGVLYSTQGEVTCCSHTSPPVSLGEDPPGTFQSSQITTQGSVPSRSSMKGAPRRVGPATRT